MKALSIFGFAAALAMAGTAFAQTSPPASNKAKMSQADCVSLWSSLDTNKAGSLTEAQSKGAVTNFKAADVNNDGKLSQSEFTTTCANGGVISRGLTGTETTPKAPSGPTSK